MADEPSIEDVVEIALRLLDDHTISDKQFDALYAYRILGQTSREAAEWIRREFRYNTCHTTVMVLSREAHDKLIIEIDRVQQGKIRFGHTLQAGADAWWAQDTTAAAAARRVMVVRRVKKNPLSAQNEPIPAFFG